jgi:hypothetical protein
MICHLTVVVEVEVEVAEPSDARLGGREVSWRRIGDLNP